MEAQSLSTWTAGEVPVFLINSLNDSHARWRLEAREWAFPLVLPPTPKLLLSISLSSQSPKSDCRLPPSPDLKMRKNYNWVQRTPRWSRSLGSWRFCLRLESESQQKESELTLVSVCCVRDVHARCFHVVYLWGRYSCYYFMAGKTETQRRCGQLGTAGIQTQACLAPIPTSEW